MRPTREGSRKLGRVLFGLGYDPDIVTDDIPAPVDYASGEVALVKRGPLGGSAAFVQSKTTTPSEADASAVDISFDAAVTAGSLLVGWMVHRASGMTFTPPTGWTALAKVEAGTFNDGEAAICYKVADGSEGTGPFTFDTGGHPRRRLTIAEFTGPTALDDSVQVSDATAGTSHTTATVTPTAGAPGLLIVAALVAAGSSPALSATGFTQIDEGGTQGSFSPESYIGYQIVASTTGSYDATVASSGSGVWGSYLLAFVGDAAEVWVYAPQLTDDDDATGIDTGTVDDAVIRLERDGVIVGASARLRIGFASAGPVTVTLQGANAIDYTDAVTLDTVAVTATGSFTAQDVDFAWGTGIAYSRYQVLVSVSAIHRPFTLELFAPATGSAVVDEHIADPTDAHDASAISVLDTAGWFTATNVETALAELAAKVVGYQAHGNLGATETFDAATGWHSGTLNANCTFTLTANPTGTVSSLFLELTQDGTGGRTITLPSSVANKADVEADQVTTAGSTALLVLLSRDGGTTWYGGWWGQAGSSIDPATTVEAETTFGLSSAVGTDTEYARQDHTHGTPDNPVTASAISTLGFVGQILISDSPSTPLVFADLIQNEAEDDLVYADV